MVLDGHISNQLCTCFCYFSILGITATQLSLAITEPSIVPNKLFSSYKKCIFIIAYYYYSLHWNGFSPRPSSAYGVYRLRDCPTLVLILLLYTALTSKALRSTMISDVLPHPWHPFNGVVLNRTARVYIVGIFTIYLSEYYSHDIVS